MNSGLKAILLSGLLVVLGVGNARAAGITFLATGAAMDSGVLTLAAGPTLRPASSGSERVYFELVSRTGPTQASGMISRASFREIADATPVAADTVDLNAPDPIASGWFKPDGLTGCLAGLALMAFLIGRRSGVR